MLGATNEENLGCSPVHNTLAVEIRQTRGQLGHPKANNVLRKIAPGIEMICNDLVGTLKHDD